MSAITEFVFALAGFLTLHMVPARPGIRNALISRLGRRRYLAIYSALSIVAIGWLLSAAIRAPVIDLWQPRPWHVVIAIAIMPFAAIFLVAGLATANPLSISLTARPFLSERPGIVAVTRHPVLWGFGLWALVHVLANGDLVAVILFGGLALFAFGGIALVESRAIARLGEQQWRTFARSTSILPMAAILARRARLPRDFRTIVLAVAALAFYAAFLFVGHSVLFGLAPIDRL